MPHDNGVAPVVRPVENREVAQVIDLWRTCGLLRPWNDPHHDISFCRQSADAELLVLVEHDDTLAGAVMVGHDGHRGWFYYLAVHPSQRRRGFGRNLLRAGENWLAGCGVPKINVMVRPENAAVRDFYSRAGYDLEEVTVMGRRLLDPRDS